MSRSLHTFSVIRNVDKTARVRIAAITEWSQRIELLPKRIAARKNFFFLRVNFISSVTEMKQFKAHERRKLDITVSLKLRRKDTTVRS